MRRVRAGILVAFAVALAVPAVAWAVGEVTQKPGTAGCVSDDGTSGTCADGTALAGATGVAVSPDGQNVYAAAYSASGVVAFSRGAGGTLAQSGCVTLVATTGCQTGVALNFPFGVTVSPDGKHVYATAFGSSAVAAFDRAPGSGALTQKPGVGACVSDDGSSGACYDGNALQSPYGLAASPDGKQLYVAASASNAVAILTRSTTTGVLTQAAGTAGCIGGASGCTFAVAMSQARGVAVSPDGRNVYVAARGSDAVDILDRDAATGALSQKPGTQGCISASGGACQPGTGLLGAQGVAVSPDGATVYVASDFANAIAIFDRDQSTGALSQKPGPAGCISEDGTGGACQDGVGLTRAWGIAVSADGASVYVASPDSSAVAIFDRDATGALSQKPGGAGCVSDDGTGGACQDGRALAEPFGVAVSPDDANVYAGAFLSGAVAVFDRARPPIVSVPPERPPLPADVVAPKVSAFKPSHRRFRVGSGRTAVAAAKRAPRGTAFRFTLSEAADVRIAIQRASSGRKVGKSCRKPTRKLRKRATCTRYAAARTLTRRGLRAGYNSIAFTGRIGAKALARGTYRATITATDAAGNRSAPRTATFAIVR